MKKYKTLVLGLLLFCLPLPVSAQGERPLNQAEWADYLARGTGLEGKLPGKPTSADYIRTLSQGGYIRKEGEDFSQATGVTAISGEKSFGIPSQGKWVQSKDKPAKLQYQITVPLEKTYLIRARVRGKEQLWIIDEGNPILVQPDNEFEWKNVALDCRLTPGEHAISVEIPPEGGLDVLELITDYSPPIAPDGGFNPSADLTYGDKATTIARALGWEHFLPIDAAGSRIWEAEAYSDAQGPLEIKETKSHGTPSQKHWILTPGEESLVTYYITVLQDGIYTIQGRFWGETENILSLEIDRHRVLFVPEKPYKFGWVTIDTVPLTQGPHRIDLELEPGTGADVFQMLKRRATGGDYLILVAERGFLENALPLTVQPEEGLRYAPWKKEEAEKATEITGSYTLSEETYYGRPSEKKWIEPVSGRVKARFEIDFAYPEEKTEEESGREEWIEVEGEKPASVEGASRFSESKDHGPVSGSGWLSATSAEVVARYQVDIPKEATETYERRGAAALSVEAERANSVVGWYAVTDSDRHGPPSEQKWIAATGKTTARFEIKIPHDGVFTILSRDFGTEPFVWKIDPDQDFYSFQRPLPPTDRDRFDWHTIGTMYLTQGRHVVEVTMNKDSGLDAWEIRKGNRCAQNLFAVYARDFGGAPLTWTVDPAESLPLFRRSISPRQKKEFDWQEIPILALPAGKHVLEVRMPAASGLDVVEFRRRGWCDEDLFSIYSRDFGPDPMVFRLDPEGNPPLLEQQIFPVEEDFFKWHEVATLSVPPGKHILEVEMSPGNGLDAWEIRKRDQCVCELESLGGLPVGDEEGRRNADKLKKERPPPEPIPVSTPAPPGTPKYPDLSPFVPGD